MAENEFTGERVVPGLVDDDLWSEHQARYAFAASLGATGDVLDIGCGAGYGTARLAGFSRRATGIDIAPDAIAYACRHYDLPNLHFAAASCLALPFAASRFQLVVAFEVIEHLADYRRMVAEAQRVLAPGGWFVVSTPNRDYYAETRASVGPNPFHEHEFDTVEFRAVLEERFASVRLFDQNHSEAFVFFTADGPASGAGAAIEAPSGRPEEAHFFVALCSHLSKPAPPPFVFVPRAANLLRERDRQLQALELRLTEAQADAAQNIARLEAELAARNAWAARLDLELAEARQRLDARERETAAMAAGYEEKIAALESDVAGKTQWAVETERRLTREIEAFKAELGACARLLDEANATVEERTRWALDEQNRRRHLDSLLALVRDSRWLKAGRRLGVGPDLDRG